MLIRTVKSSITGILFLVQLDVRALIVSCKFFVLDSLEDFPAIHTLYHFYVPVPAFYEFEDDYKWVLPYFDSGFAFATPRDIENFEKRFFVKGVKLNLTTSQHTVR